MVDVKRRASDAKKNQDILRAPKWSCEVSTKDLQYLAEIVRDNKSKKTRWDAFESSNLPTETKSFFNDFLEPSVRKYVKAANGEDLYGDLVRWAIGMGPDAEYSSLMEFEKAIDRYISQANGSNTTSKSPQKSYQDDDEVSTSGAEILGSIIGYGIVFVPILLVGMYFAGFFDPTEEEIAEKKRQQARIEERQLEQCVDELTANISSSCESDPVFSYCSLNYESYEIIGSGCTSMVRNQGSYSAQVQYCKNRSLGSVQRTCAIEVYGCASVTGDLNCKD